MPEERGGICGVAFAVRRTGWERRGVAYQTYLPLAAALFSDDHHAIYPISLTIEQCLCLLENLPICYRLAYVRRECRRFRVDLKTFSAFGMVFANFYKGTPYHNDSRLRISLSVKSK